MTTVLAQDHFYNDFLSLHVSVKTNNNAMMMLLLPCAGKDASGLAPAGLRTSHRAARLPTEWLKSIAYCLGASNASLASRVKPQRGRLPFLLQVAASLLLRCSMVLVSTTAINLPG